jgi:hypothetical protein
MRFVESADRSIKIQDGAGPHADGHNREILRMECVSFKNVSSAYILFNSNSLYIKI